MSMLNIVLLSIIVFVIIVTIPPTDSSQTNALAFPSTVTTTTDQAWDLFGPYHKMIIANDGSWHLFYGEGTVLKHTASSDGGVTWTTPDAINTSVNQNQVDVDYAKSGPYSNRIHIVYPSPVSGASITYRYATVSGTSLTYSAENNIGQCGGIATYYSSLTVTGSSSISIVYGFIGNSNAICEVTSTDGGSTFGSPVTVYQTSGHDKFMRLLPLSSTNDNEMIIWTNVFAYNALFSIHRVSGTWDTSATTITTNKLTDGDNGGKNDLFSADYDSANNIHLAYIKNDNTLQYLKYNGAWSASTQLDSFVDSTQINTVVDNNGNVYVFYVKAGTIYYVKSSNSGVTWSTPTIFVPGEILPQRIVTPHHGFNSGMSSTWPVFWIAGATSPFNIRTTIFPGVIVDDTDPAALGSISAPTSPVQVNTQITASDSFSDDSDDTHTATWNWGDGTTSTGTVTESGGSGSVQDTHTYTAPGVYTITLTVNNSDGATSSTQFKYVVVYDPNGGFVTGGGWIISPPGAYPANPTATGKANFGFNVKYHSGSSTVPTGKTEFSFNAGNIDLSSTGYNWLVVSSPTQAQFQGTGTINGAGNYLFNIAIQSGSTNYIRIQINDTNNNVVYDTQPGAPLTASPTTPLGGGSFIIHPS